MAMSPWFPHGQPEPIVLASASPRRQALLTQVGLHFEQLPADADETWPEGLAPEPAAALLAERKAMAVATDHARAIVIGADTVVVVDGRPLGKPASDDDALAMLTLLAGRTHTVITGLALVDGATGERITDAVLTDVTMRRACAAELEAYVATGEPRDKAGAYGIQGYGAGLVTDVRGCYFNVVGLPITRMIHHLQRLAERRAAAVISGGDTEAVQ